MVFNLSALTEYLGINISLLARIVTGLIVIVIFYYLSNLLTKKLRKIRVDVKPEVLINFERLMKILFITAGVAIALTIIGIDVSSLIVAAGFAGIVIGLAAQQVLNQLFSGLSLILEKRIRVGDTIMIGDNIGIVESIGLMSTRMRLFTGEVLTVPNADLVSSRLYNYSESKARRIDIPVSVSYESDLGKAISAIEEVLDNNENILAEPPPVISIDNLGDSGINLKVIFWVPRQAYWETRRTIIKEIKEKLEKTNIEIPYPRRVIWVKQNVDNEKQLS